MYFIQLFATRKCNQNCYYCTTKGDDSIEIDIDYLKWSLDQFPTELTVELTGGEIGLLNNLDQFYKTVKNHPNVKRIIALSNGLIRKIGVDWLDEVEYCEHLIYDIADREIHKFYPLDLKCDHKYVIVTTEKTTKSLLKNWKYFESLGLFKNNFFYKIMNHKSHQDIGLYFDELLDLYTRLNDKYFKRMVLSYKLKNLYKEEKSLCQKYPPNIFLDLQRRQLGHCAVNINKSIKVDFNKENLFLLMNGKMNENDYCQNCYCFDNGKGRSPENNRSYEQ